MYAKIRACMWRMFRINYMNTPSESQLAAQFEFCILAIQYHVSGRFAALSLCIPIAGNLLHHAIEMYLKCVLVKTMSLEQLKNKGHNLTNLWKCFKEVYTDSSYDAHDWYIAELQKFQRLRYPDFVVTEGMQVSYVPFIANFSPLPNGPQPPYHLILEYVDLIAKISAMNSGRGKGAFPLPSSKLAKEYFYLNNLHPFLDELD